MHIGLPNLFGYFESSAIHLSLDNSVRILSRNKSCIIDTVMVR